MVFQRRPVTMSEDGKEEKEKQGRRSQRQASASKRCENCPLPLSHTGRCQRVKDNTPLKIQIKTSTRIKKRILRRGDGQSKRRTSIKDPDFVSNASSGSSPLSSSRLSPRLSPRKFWTLPTSSLESQVLALDESEDGNEIELEKLWKEVQEEDLGPLVQKQLESLEAVRKMYGAVAACGARMGMHPPPCIDALKLMKEMKDMDVPEIQTLLERTSRGRYYVDLEEERTFLATSCPHDDQKRRRKRSWQKTKSDEDGEEGEDVDGSTIHHFSDLVYGYDDNAQLDYVDRVSRTLMPIPESVSVEGTPSRFVKKLATNTISGSPSKVKKGSSSTNTSQVVPSQDPPVPVEEWHPAGWGRNPRVFPTDDLDVSKVHPANIQTKMEPPSRWEQERYFEEEMHRFGNVVEDNDDISIELSLLQSHFVSLCGVNWRNLVRVQDLAHSEVSIQNILTFDAQMSTQLESYYNSMTPVGNHREFRVRALPRDIVAFVSRQANTQTATVIAHATGFAMTLRIGDDVDALDRNGTWGKGLVVAEHREGGVILKYVKIHFLSWGSECDEWISTFGGRLLPPGMCLPRPQLPDTQTNNELMLPIGPSQAQAPLNDNDTVENLPPKSTTAATV